MARWGRAVEAATELVRATLVLRLHPASHTVRLLGQVRDAAQKEPVRADQLVEARRVGHIVDRVARVLPWRPTCLRQALAAQRMLRRRSIPCRLHLGVDRPGGTAHAWVTVQDVPVVGRAGIERVVALAAFG